MPFPPFGTLGPASFAFLSELIPQFIAMYLFLWGFIYDWLPHLDVSMLKVRMMFAFMLTVCSVLSTELDMLSKYLLKEWRNFQVMQAHTLEVPHSNGSNLIVQDPYLDAGSHSHCLGMTPKGPIISFIIHLWMPLIVPSIVNLSRSHFILFC